MAKFNGFINDYSGLSSEEVIKLQQAHGRNELVPEKKDIFRLPGLFVLEEFH